jgi:predicted dehydrogenase
MDSRLRIAISGTGHLGSIHAKLLAAQAPENSVLCGIYDPDQERSKSLAATYSVQSFSSPEASLEQCDALIIASPTSTHYQVACQAIEQGIHCFIEKPITATYQQARDLISLAEKHNVIVQVGHVERFNPALAALHNYEIKPLFIETHRLAQFKPRATDVSVIHDLMIHDLDIILWLVRSPVISIDANAVAVLTETADIANARITFANGCVANITASRISAQPMRKMRIFQQNGYLSVDFAKPSVDVYRLSDSAPGADAMPATMLGQIDAGPSKRYILFEQPAVPAINAIAEEHKAFVQAIQGQRPVAVSAHDAAEALRIAGEIAIKTGSMAE